jgi:hypothetical protein
MKTSHKIALSIAIISACIFVVGLFTGYQVNNDFSTDNKYPIKTSFGWSYDSPEGASCLAASERYTGFPFVHTVGGCAMNGVNITAFILDVLSGLLFFAGIIGVFWLIYYYLFRKLQNKQ